MKKFKRKAQRNRAKKLKDFEKKLLEREKCKHERKFGREVADNKMERVCSDCGKIIDYVEIKSSGFVA